MTMTYNAQTGVTTYSADDPRAPAQSQPQNKIVVLPPAQASFSPAPQPVSQPAPAPSPVAARQQSSGNLLLDIVQRTGAGVTSGAGIQQYITPAQRQAIQQAQPQPTPQPARTQTPVPQLSLVSQPKPFVYSDTKSVQGIAPQGSGSLLTLAGGSVSGLLDISAGSIAAAPVSAANIGREILGKPPLDVGAAYETGVGLRRTATYGAALIPGVGEVLSPLIAATAISDFAVEPNIANAAIAGGAVIGISALKSAPEIGGFLGASEKTVGTLTKVSGTTTGAMKIVDPMLRVAGGAYLEKTTFGIGQKALGLQPQTIMGEIQKGDFATAHALEKEQGSQFGSFVAGGMAAGALVSGFNIKPNFAEKDLIVREAPIQGAKSYFRFDESFVGRDTFEGPGTLQARFGETPLITKPALLTGEKITTGAFENPEFFNQKVLISSQVKGASFTYNQDPVVGEGWGKITSPVTLENIGTQENIPNIKTQYLKSPNIVEESRVGTITSLEETRLARTASIGELQFPKETIAYEKIDITPQTSVTQTEGKTGLLTVEKGLLVSEVQYGKGLGIMPEKIGTVRSSGTISLDTKEFLANPKWQPKTSTGEFDYTVYSKTGTNKPMKPFNLKGGAVETQLTKTMTSELGISPTKTGTVGITQSIAATTTKPISLRGFAGTILHVKPAQTTTTQSKTVSSLEQKMFSMPSIKTANLQTTKTSTSFFTLPKSFTETATRTGTIVSTLQKSSLSFGGITEPLTKSIGLASTKQHLTQTELTKVGMLQATASKLAQLTATKAITETKTATTLMPSIPKIPFIGGLPFKFSMKTPEVKFGLPGVHIGKISRPRGAEVKLIVQSSPIRRILFGESNVATTKKTASAYLKQLKSYGALTSFGTAEEFKKISKATRRKSTRKKRK